MSALGNKNKQKEKPSLSTLDNFSKCVRGLFTASIYNKQAYSLEPADNHGAANNITWTKRIQIKLLIKERSQKQ